MAVPTTITDLSATIASNSPAGSDVIGTTLDDFFRAHAGIIRRFAANSTVVSATTTDIGAVEAEYLSVSGTTTITGLGTIAAGIRRVLVFEGALTFTHNATSLILPGGANITTAAGDIAYMRSLGSGNWRCEAYTKASGVPINGANFKADGSVTMTGNLVLGAGVAIVGEGTTADDYETTLSFGEPTADRTINLPDASDTLVGKATTDTLTNKRVTLRKGSTASSATPTINTDNVDLYQLTAQAADITSFTTNLSGTPTDGQGLIIEITGTAARAITWGASFESSTVTLPTTTVSTDKSTVGFIWNSATSKWRCIGKA